jgi:hypothetical protein
VSSSILGSVHLNSSQVQTSKRISFKARYTFHFCQSISDGSRKTLGSIHRSFPNERIEKIFRQNSAENERGTANLFEQNMQRQRVERTKNFFDSELRLSQNLEVKNSIRHPTFVNVI